jgi:hypothetical protein
MRQRGERGRVYHRQPRLAQRNRPPGTPGRSASPALTSARQLVLPQPSGQVYYYNLYHGVELQPAGPRR